MKFTAIIVKIHIYFVIDLSKKFPLTLKHMSVGAMCSL